MKRVIKHFESISKKTFITLLTIFMLIIFLFTHQTLQAAESLPGKDAYISGIIVNNIVDGSGNFDSDNAPGNDSNNNNRIVRTFDTVRYIVEYTLNMKPDSTKTSLSQAYVNVELSIDGQKGDVEFVTGDMPWLENPKSSYSDGKIIVTGKTLIKPNNGVDPIPGTQGFSVVMKCMGVKNGTVLRPNIKLWLYGNNTDEYVNFQCNEEKYTMDGQNCAVTASASSRLDIKLTSGSGITARYADLNKNTIGIEPSNGKLGMMGNFEYVIMLHGASAQKGIMGIELPDGDISFDISLSATYKERKQNNTTSNVNETQMWDYTVLNQPNYGSLGRKMNYYLNSKNLASIPHLGTDRKGIESPGNNKVEYLSKNKYRVTVSNYQITSHFPNGHNWSQNSIAYQENEGCFTGGKIQFYTEIPEELNDITDYWTRAEAGNIQYTTKSGAHITKETRTNNNAASNTFTRYPNGSFQKTVLAVSANSRTILANPWTAGNVIKSIDSTIGINVGFNANSGNTSKLDVYGVEHVIKFDDKAFTPLGTYWQYYGQYENNIKSKINLLYATKKDGTGWLNETELQQTRITDLVLYSSLEEIQNQGKTCVAVIVEEREGKYVAGSYRDYASTTVNFKIRNDMPINKVYTATTDTYLYYKSKAENWTVENSSFADTGFITPDVTMTTYGTLPQYYKSEFDDSGAFIKNHSDYLRGASVYVIGENNSITKGFNEKVTTSSGSKIEKNNYNLNFSERQVNYYIQPKVTSVAENPNPTTITITETLPKWLTYIPNSGRFGGIYHQSTSTSEGYIEGGTALEPQITKNEDGTTTLIWTIENVIPNSQIDKINYSCTIGNVSNPVNDVDEVNNPITTITNMSSTYGSKTADIQTSLNVIKSAATSLSKQTAQRYIEKNGKLEYSLNFTNSSLNNTRPFNLYDVLPFNGDSRGSSFDGTYKLELIEILKDNANVTLTQNIKVFYTTDTNIRNDKTFDAQKINDMNIHWIEALVRDDGDTLSYAVNKEATGIRISGDSLITMESLNCKLYLKTDGNKAEDIYVNSASVFAERFADTVFSAKVSTQAVSRKISGYAFIDNNKNDYLDSNDTILSNKTIILLDSSGNQARDALGNTVAPVKTNAKGYYEFSDLAAGSYQVTLYNSNYSQINRRYKVMDVKSYKQESDNQYLRKDNDAILVGKDSSDSKYGYSIKEYQRYSAGSFIMDNISFDTADKMSSAIESFDDLNFGFIENTTNISLKKVNGKNPSQALNGAVFSIYRYNQSNLLDEGQTIPSDNIDINSGEWTKIGDITSENDGKMIVKNLSQGWYVIKETTAPKGYQISTGYYFVTIDFNDTLNSEISMKSVADSEYEHQLDNGTYIIRNYPFQIFSFIKIDSYDYDIKLQNAKFGLYRLTCSLSHNHSNPESEQCWSLSNTVKSDKNGNVSFNDLSKGLYALVELQAPDDYSLPAGYWTIQISNTDEPIITCINEGFDKPLAFLKKDNNLLLPNQKIRTLPLSGSLLTPHHIYTIGGALTLVGILIYRYQKNRMRTKHKRE